MLKQEEKKKRFLIIILKLDPSGCSRKNELEGTKVNAFILHFATRQDSINSSSGKTQKGEIPKWSEV